jgi:hypothetical protein
MEEARRLACWTGLDPTATPLPLLSVFGCGKEKEVTSVRPSPIPLPWPPSGSALRSSAQPANVSVSCSMVNYPALQ